MTKRNWFATLAALAGLSVLGAQASAFAVPGQDATILIDRALNSPTLTVRFSGVNATMAELKVNGTSVASRAVESKDKRGQTTFTLDLTMLGDGQNDIEVRLFDKDGRVVGSQKSVVTTEDGSKSPVYLMNPKVGSQLRGPIEIKVGFGKDMKNTYVSFFVNGQFKSMTNTAPYSFVWDTSRELNGWHEIEAWVVDDSSNTFKTRKARVMVDNPGGKTERNLPKPEPVVTAPIVKPVVAPAKTAKPATGTAAPVNTSTTVTPGVMGSQASNTVEPAVGTRANLKPIGASAATAMGPRTSTPSIASPAKAKTVAKAAPNTGIELTVRNPGITPNRSAAPVLIERGTRLPVTGNFAISLNSAPVVFDVQPRVQDGIPLTPFRALFEQAGGKVDWENLSKAFTATGMGKEVYVKIGDKLARVNKIEVSMEIAPFLERGRAIVPLSFIREGLDVDVQYDAATGHVLITSKKG